MTHINLEAMIVTVNYDCIYIIWGMFVTVTMRVFTRDSTRINSNKLDN